MPYRFRDDIAIADAAFEAWGGSREELFTAAADALLNVMVEDPAVVRPDQIQEVRLESGDLEMLLFDFLNELIFLKDALRLLLRVASIAIAREGETFTLQATLRGETVDRLRESLHADVKAVTMHRFRVEERDGAWRAEVVLDI
jgi:SHS2 domain-containing protein